ncbi:hypothetical protein [Chitinolyticbacter meiyuanensis]|uniref:hypothetical protein n=1 Tax=Chitinolyticbacter meiyuanensis TaxID=682798 RepID=UPI0011E5CD4B|nr:hypothetical protein [Chitinolyticbacter meiyuanensis]
MSGVSTLPASLQKRLHAELKPGEIVVWAGQPIPSHFMRSGFGLWLFFIPWTAFSVFWMAGASGFTLPDFSHGWSFFPLFGLPFLLIGLGGLGTPYFLWRKAKHIVYATTSLRALILQGEKTFSVQSFWPADLTRLERKEHPDGSGSLFFAKEAEEPGGSKSKLRGFMAIAKVRQAEQALERLRLQNQ